MIKHKSKLGTIFVKIYAALVIVAFLFLIVMIKKSPFAGVYLVLLTFPWSFFLSSFLDFYRIQDSIPLLINLFLSVSCALPNAVIVYCIGKTIERLNRSL